MPPRRGVLNAHNLVALGPDRLASLLMEFAEADASVRKRLVLAVSEVGGAAAVSKAADRRLNALANSRGHVDWEKARSYAADLDGLRRFVAESLTSLDPAAAAERLERFLELAPEVLERVDDSDGRAGAVFERMVADLGVAWGQMKHCDPAVLAQKVLGFMVADRYGICGSLIEGATPALGDAGLTALGELARKALADTPPHADGRRYDRKRETLQQVLAEVADAKGDVDAFIAIQTASADRRPDTLAISRRLLRSKRPKEALEWLDKEGGRPGLRVMTYADLEATPPGASRSAVLDWERETLRIDALEMLKRRGDAQDVRWRLFEHTLEPDLLRSYLKALPDFEDDAALERAFAFAGRHASSLVALSFLVRWPNLKLAAELVSRRIETLDGRRYEVLHPAAEVLGEHHPLAATILHRRMIDDVLERAASKSYPYAAKNLWRCTALAERVDWRASVISPHAAYIAELKKRHGRKAGFWSIVAGLH